MPTAEPVVWRLRSRAVDTGDHTLIMGIVNVTPDSFSDGGMFTDGRTDATNHRAALRHAQALLAAGADLIDVGGESTRPGAAAVSLDDEMERVIPLVGALASDGAIVSIDTSKPEVAAAAIAVGAEIVNDVTGLSNPAMLDVCARGGAGVVIMHMQGTPRTMQADPTYGDVVAEVREYLVTRAEGAITAGIDRARISIDPGIGFGKTTGHNLELLAKLGAFTATGFPVVLGASRKRFLGTILGAAGRPTDPGQRDVATAATCALAAAAGVAVVRVHDVASALEATRVADAIVRSAPPHARGSGSDSGRS